MFITHGAWLRKHARWFFAGILLLLIPGFIAMFTTTSGSSDRAKDLPSVRGKKVNLAEFERARRAVRAQMFMNRGRVTQTAETDDEVNRQATMRLVLTRKIKDMGIRVSDTDVALYVQRIGIPLTPQGEINPYSQFMIELNNYGVSVSGLWEMLRSDLAIQRLQQLVVSAAKVTPQQVSLNVAPFHERTGIDLVEFDVADYKGPVTITDAEAMAYYEKNKKSFLKPPQVKVQYARFPIADAASPSPITDDDVSAFYDRNKAKYTDADGKPKSLEVVKDSVRKDMQTMRARRATADRATELTLKLVSQPGGPLPDFDKLAVAAGAAIVEADYFSPRETVAGVKAGPEFNRAAFALDAKDNPFSDVIEGEDSMYVLQYVAGKPAYIPGLDEIKTQVVEQIKLLHAYEGTMRRGKECAAKAQQAIAAGKQFGAACAEMDLKVETIAPFTLSDQTFTNPAAPMIGEKSLGMKTNTVSDFLQTAKGGVFFYLRERIPADPAVLQSNQLTVARQMLSQTRQAIWQDWVTALSREEQIQFGQIHARPKESPVEEETDADTQPVPTPSS